MYPLDTICGGDRIDTLRIIRPVSHWYDRAKKRMRELEITQLDLLKVFGVETRGAIGHYLSGRRDPAPTVFPALADTLSMSLDELLRGKPALSGPERSLLEAYRAADATGKVSIERTAAAQAKLATVTPLRKRK